MESFLGEKESTTNFASAKDFCCAKLENVVANTINNNWIVGIISFIKSDQYKFWFEDITTIQLKKFKTIFCVRYQFQQDSDLNP